jgi:uncharacterized UBP type Zn finger protein
MSKTNKPCEHLQNFDIKKLKHKSEYLKFECEECIKIKSYWVQLRICQICGKMLCCDSSPNQHARKHYEEVDHKIISSAELGDNWLYCFEDDSTLEY